MSEPQLRYLSDLALAVDRDANVLLCCRESCKTALPVQGSRPSTHLRDKHQVPLRQRKHLTNILRQLRLYSPDPANVQPRPDGSPPHPHLQVVDGYYCTSCGERNINLDILKRHYSRLNRDRDTVPDSNSPSTKPVCPAAARGRPRLAEIDKLIEYVYLQTWCRGPRSQYWLISHNGSIVRPFHSAVSADHLLSVRQHEAEAMAQIESLQDATNRTSAKASGRRLTFGEESPWIERTGWEAMFRGRDRATLLQLISLPEKLADQRFRALPLVVGQDTPDCEEGLVSAEDDEARIASIVALVDPMMERCDETARRTSHNLRRWLKSIKPDTAAPKPFTLVRLATTTQRYRVLQRKLLAFVLRLYRMDARLRRQLTGLRFDKATTKLLDALWQDAYWAELETGVQHRHGADTTRHFRDRLQQGRGEHGDEDEYEEEEEDEDEYEEEEEEEEAEEGGTSGEEDKEEEGEEVIIDSTDDDSHYETDNSMTGDDEGEAPQNSATMTAEEGWTIYPPTADNKQSLNPDQERLLELLFGLSLALCKEKPLHDNPASLTIVFFSGILGFSDARQSFLSARSYTPYLAAQLYNQRLLFLESTLPVRPYKALEISKRPHTGSLKLLNSVRQRFMVIGAPSSFDELFSLMNYGRVIARTDTPPVLLYWSDDGGSVRWNDSAWLPMAQFRLIAQYYLEESSRLCDELMLGLAPVVNLAGIKDIIANTASGYSFVTEPANKLKSSYLQLAEHACTARRTGLSKRGRWDRQAIKAYLKKEEAFRTSAGVAMQTQGGQAARWTELLSLWCQNTEYGLRGLFVYGSQLMYISRHHKAKRSTNHEFIVARFLGAELSVALFKYLVYIRPFIDLLFRNVHHIPLLSSSPLLFRSHPLLDSKPWPSSRFNQTLKTVTAKKWGQAVNSRIYRQLSVGITEKHVREVYEPFNQYDDKSAAAERNVIFAWQAGHRPRQRGSTYGLDGAFPTTLQPRLLNLYQWASTRWHEFLHIPSKTVLRRDTTESRPQVSLKRGRSSHTAMSHNSGHSDSDDEIVLHDGPASKRLCKGASPVTAAAQTNPQPQLESCHKTVTAATARSAAVPPQRNRRSLPSTFPAKGTRLYRSYTDSTQQNDYHTTYTPERPEGTTVPERATDSGGGQDNPIYVPESDDGLPLSVSEWSITSDERQETVKLTLTTIQPPSANNTTQGALIGQNGPAHVPMSDNSPRWGGSEWSITSDEDNELKKSTLTTRQYPRTDSTMPEATAFALFVEKRKEEFLYWQKTERSRNNAWLQHIFKEQLQRWNDRCIFCLVREEPYHYDDEPCPLDAQRSSADDIIGRHTRAIQAWLVETALHGQYPGCHECGLPREMEPSSEPLGAGGLLGSCEAREGTVEGARGPLEVWRGVVPGVGGAGGLLEAWRVRWMPSEIGFLPRTVARIACHEGSGGWSLAIEVLAEVLAL
ncbi:hypothetical protein PWT90_10273 [Aphanocladium album]|nr:hypothetical protein PWT90_10273 [Aphanocladium album]